jgi:hypothetical protein
MVQLFGIQDPDILDSVNIRALKNYRPRFLWSVSVNSVFVLSRTKLYMIEKFSWSRAVKTKTITAKMLYFQFTVSNLLWLIKFIIKIPVLLYFIRSYSDHSVRQYIRDSLVISFKHGLIYLLCCYQVCTHYMVSTHEPSSGLGESRNSAERTRYQLKYYSSNGTALFKLSFRASIKGIW